MTMVSGLLVEKIFVFKTWWFKFTPILAFFVFLLHLIIYHWLCVRVIFRQLVWFLPPLPPLPFPIQPSTTCYSGRFFPPTSVRSVSWSLLSLALAGARRAVARRQSWNQCVCVCVCVVWWRVWWVVSGQAREWAPINLLARWSVRSVVCGCIALRCLPASLHNWSPQITRAPLGHPRCRRRWPAGRLVVCFNSNSFTLNWLH